MISKNTHWLAAVLLGADGIKTYCWSLFVTQTAILKPQFNTPIRLSLSFFPNRYSYIPIGFHNDRVGPAEKC